MLKLICTRIPSRNLPRGRARPIVMRLVTHGGHFQFVDVES